MQPPNFRLQPKTLDISAIGCRAATISIGSVVDRGALRSANVRPRGRCGIGHLAALRLSTAAYEL